MKSKSPRRQKVLVLCTANSCRSQMAEGVLRHFGGGRFEVASAGTDPSRVHPVAIQVMQEVGIDISGHRSKHLDEFRDAEFDYIMTVCDQAKEACPVFPGKAKVIHWSFPDPPHEGGVTAEVVAEFRKVRDLILERFKWVAEGGLEGA